MQDPISDLLTRIRNGYMAKKESIVVPGSKVKQAILNVLQQEGYIQNYQVNLMPNNKVVLDVSLKYYQGKPVISKISRVSKPGLRIYKDKQHLPKVLGGFGISIISTSSGIISNKQAKKLGQGGEIICFVE